MTFFHFSFLCFLSSYVLVLFVCPPSPECVVSSSTFSNGLPCSSHPALCCVILFSVVQSSRCYEQLNSDSFRSRPVTTVELTHLRQRMITISSFHNKFWKLGETFYKHTSWSCPHFIISTYIPSQTPTWRSCELPGSKWHLCRFMCVLRVRMARD